MTHLLNLYIYIFTYALTHVPRHLCVVRNTYLQTLCSLRNTYLPTLPDISALEDRHKRVHTHFTLLTNAIAHTGQRYEFEIRQADVNVV